MSQASQATTPTPSLTESLYEMRDRLQDERRELISAIDHLDHSNGDSSLARQELEYLDDDLHTLEHEIDELEAHVEALEPLHAPYWDERPALLADGLKGGVQIPEWLRGLCSDQTDPFVQDDFIVTVATPLASIMAANAAAFSSYQAGVLGVGR